MSVHTWGESPQGNWQLEIHNEGRYMGKLKRNHPYSETLCCQIDALNLYRFTCCAFVDLTTDSST